MGNLIKASAEFNERLFPHILRSRNYITDSGGPGKFRGGCGSHFVKEARTPTYVSQYSSTSATSTRGSPAGSRAARTSAS